MNYTVMVQGKMNFMGIDIPVVSGGFGENQKCVSDKTVAEIHEMTTFNVRARINSNIKRFKDGVDIIDLKDERIYDVNTLQQLGYAKQSITQAEHIYLLSERGYAKLIKIMDDDKSWEVHDQLVDNYFNMKLELQKQVPSYLIDDSIARAEAWIEEQKAKRALELQAQEAQTKATTLQLTLDEIVKQCTTFDEFNRKCNKCIRAISNKSGQTPQDVWMDVYGFLYDKHGMNLRQRAKNRRDELNQERYEKTGKYYSHSTLKGKVPMLSTVSILEYITVLETIESLALKYDINITDLFELTTKETEDLA